MSHEVFVSQPCLDLYEGIRVTADSAFSFQNEKVTQQLQDLQLNTILREEGISGNNAYRSESHITLRLNPGDVLLFHESRGYYLPSLPAVSIREAVDDITSLEALPRFREVDRE